MKSRPLLVLNSALTPNFACLAVGESPAAIQWASLDTRLSMEGMDLMINAMQQGNTELSALAGIVFTIGPGSFTGIRTGLSMLKGMTFGHSVKAVGLSSLKAMAAPFFGMGKKVCPILDARMNQVYAAVYDADGNALLPDQAVAPEELSPHLDGDIIFVGKDARTFEPFWKNDGMKSSDYRELSREQLAESIAREGARCFERGEVVPVTELTPLYLRKSYAEIKSESPGA